MDSQIFVFVANLLSEEFIKIMAFIMVYIELTAAKELNELGLDRQAIGLYSFIWFTKVKFIITRVIYIIFMAILFIQVFYHFHQVNFPNSKTIHLKDLGPNY